MLKNNGAGLENKNGISPYVSWFVREGQELKRGGTAPINQSRKNRSNMASDQQNMQDHNDIAIENAESTKPVSLITTSKVPNPARIGTSTTNENHRITKVVNSAGINTYKLTRVANPEEDSNRGQVTLAQAFGIGGCDNDTNPAPKFERKNFGGGVSQHNDDFGQSEFVGGFGGSTNERNTENFQSNRPQTAHIKGSGAFRRGRILNESSHNYEEFQTPNTGNLELESLHNLNNKASERGPGQNVQQKPRIGVQDGRPMTSAQHTRQPTGENETGGYKVDSKVLQRGFGKGEGVGFGVGLFGKEDSERERINNIKFSRVKTADTKNNKAKQILGGRRYAEDMLDEPEDPFGNEGMSRNKGNEVNEEKQVEIEKNNLVAMIGRTMQENINPKRNLEEDNEIYGGGHQKEQQDQFAVLALKSPTQRPPARKNGQAMFLNNYAGLQEADKKAAMMSPTKGTQIGAMRPPSRQKVPSKAGGLDASDEARKNETEGGEPGLGRRGEQGTRKHKFVKDNEFGLDDEDFENYEFDQQVFDIADFLEGEDAPRGQNLVRPNTSVASQRATQTSQSHRPQVGGNKPMFSQSAKGGRGNDSHGHIMNSLLTTNKAEQAERIKTLKNQKEGGRLESALGGNRTAQKAKGQSKGKGELEVCDILSDDDSDSNHSQEPVQTAPKRVTTAQPSIMSKGLSNKVLESEKPGHKPLAFKDKKSQIVFIYNKESQQGKKEKIDLPFETTLEKDFVGLFAN